MTRAYEPLAYFAHKVSFFGIIPNKTGTERRLPRLLIGLRPPRLAFPVGFWESPVDFVSLHLSKATQRGAGGH
jgi:hypothetical protein